MRFFAFNFEDFFVVWYVIECFVCFDGGFFNVICCGDEFEFLCEFGVK